VGTSGLVGEDENERALETTPVEVVRTRELVQVNVEAFSKDRDLGAFHVISGAREKLRRQTGAEHLAAFGIGPWTVGDVLDLSSIAGAHWETRAQLSVQFALGAFDVQPIQPIESATVTLEVASEFPN
jgi:hypothetical protein